MERGAGNGMIDIVGGEEGGGVLSILKQLNISSFNIFKVEFYLF